MFSAVITGSFYVLDISKKRFIYIKPDDLLLCGYSVKEAMKLNFDLFPLIIHPGRSIFMEQLFRNYPSTPTSIT